MPFSKELEDNIKNNRVVLSVAIKFNVKHDLMMLSRKMNIDINDLAETFLREKIKETLDTRPEFKD